MIYLKLFEDFDFDDEDEEEDETACIFEEVEEDGTHYIKVYEDKLKAYFENKDIIIDSIKLNNIQKFDDEYEMYITIENRENYTHHKKLILFDFEKLPFVESVDVFSSWYLVISFKFDMVVELY